MDKNNLENLAQKLFPQINKTKEDYYKLYPRRELKEGARVTRFAPSPTGFLHVGGVYSALVSNRVASPNGGICILRIEDTDKKREVTGGVGKICTALKNFGITFEEGVNDEENEVGAYGPYKQSNRAEIYQSFVKSLIETGDAYPCFCTEEELKSIREKQEIEGITPGYYGEWTKYRYVGIEEILSKLEEKTPFVIRLRSKGDSQRTVTIKDQIKGKIEMPENEQDIVILKSDGIPTYHFAHVVDDYLMNVTHVIRGDEWLSSWPVHFELFNVLGWDLPKYAHISPIQKNEDGKKRKLSKRKDPEASVDFYHENGIPSEGLIEYLLNIANSSFEDWRRDNPEKSNKEFELRLDKMSVSGALFDMVKLTNVCKNVISFFSAEYVYDKTLSWLKEFDKDFAFKFEKDKDYMLKILNIERGGDKPRKDISRWSEVKDYVSYFYDDLFQADIEESGYCFSEKLDIDDIRNFLDKFLQVYDINDDNEVWFSKLKELALEFGFSKNAKEYKKNPDRFKGHIGDAAEILRVTLTNRKNTPDLSQIMSTMGLDRVKNRFGMV